MSQSGEPTELSLSAPREALQARATLLVDRYVDLAERLGRPEENLHIDTLMHEQRQRNLNADLLSRFVHLLPMAGSYGSSFHTSNQVTARLLTETVVWEGSAAKPASAHAYYLAGKKDDKRTGQSDLLLVRPAHKPEAVSHTSGEVRTTTVPTDSFDAARSAAAVRTTFTEREIKAMLDANTGILTINGTTPGVINLWPSVLYDGPGRFASLFQRPSDRKWAKNYRHHCDAARRQGDALGVIWRESSVSKATLTTPELLSFKAFEYMAELAIAFGQTEGLKKLFDKRLEQETISPIERLQTED